MSDDEIKPSDDELIYSYLEDQTTPSEEKRFRLLLGEEAFRRRVAEHAIDHAVLYRRGLMDESLAAGSRWRRFNRRLLVIAAIAASLLLGIGTILSLLGPGDEGRGFAHKQASIEPADSATTVAASTPSDHLPKPSDDRPVVGHITNVCGQVLQAAGFDRPASPVVGADKTFYSGDMLHTLGTESFALLKLMDDTVLAVAGDTELVCSIVDSQKRVDLRGGDIMAQVTRQQDEAPMVIETPVAQAEILGTTLSLFANLLVTELAVMEGQVRLQQLEGGQSVEVHEGESAIVAEGSAITTKPIGRASSAWEEDFEEAWPKRWRAGHWIHYGLPEGSKGAARAEAREDAGGHAFLSTGREWADGLFRIGKETYLNLTYKLNARRWFLIRVDTRPEDYRGAYGSKFMFRSPKLWNVPLHRWHTVSIPISEFRDASGMSEGESPGVGDIAFFLLLWTHTPDPELFVDRIWVSQGPVEEAVVLKHAKLSAGDKAKRVRSGAVEE